MAGDRGGGGVTVAATPLVYVDHDLIDEIASEMDLREPNRDALITLAGHLSVWQHSEQEGTPEFVFDLATGVGKTFLMAAAINYLARFGVRNLQVFVPRTTILRKTLANLTPGHPKSVVDGFPFHVTVITPDNLDTAATAAVMEDPSQVKVYVATVQAFIGRESEIKRKVHDFKEELGARFYETLQSLPDLVVFADEHHTYYGPSFSTAVRDLKPMALVGLTGTPHPKTPDEQIVYRYPLANAIEDRHVKRPVIVGRSDELTDRRTKLYDGVLLLRAKQEAADLYTRHSGDPPRNLLMLVVADSIEEAQEVETDLTAPGFFDGDYEGRVLRVDSSQPEEALEALSAIEEPDSPYRIIVSVQMLKEGWDVATVAVICSLRPSVSEVLTEQTLGRGLRLPWGKWVENAFLNELDVVAHASFEKILREAQALRERRVDWETWQAEQEAKLQRLAEEAATAESSEQASTELGKMLAGTSKNGGQAEDDDATPAAGRDEEPAEDWAGSVTPVEKRHEQARQAADEPEKLKPDLSLGEVAIPVMRVEEIPASYSLSDVWAHGQEAFADLGRRFARDPEGTLRRTAVEGRTEVQPDGTVVTRLKPVRAETKITSDASPPPLAEAKERLVSAILGSQYATGTAEEVNTAKNIVEALVAGAGEQAGSIGAYLTQISGALVREIGRVVSELTPQTQRQEIVESRKIRWEREPAEATSDEFFDGLDPKVGYTGWRKHLYSQARFHSRPERDAAVAVDESDEVAFWVRLYNNDLPVAWTGDGKVRDYNPDLLVVEHSVTADGAPVVPCWLVEVKADKDAENEDVTAKFKAAARWAAKVNEKRPDERWNVLRVTETDIKNAKSSWSSLKQLGKRAFNQ